MRYADRDPVVVGDAEPALVVAHRQLVVDGAPQLVVVEADHVPVVMRRSDYVVQLARLRVDARPSGAELDELADVHHVRIRSAGAPDPEDAGAAVVDHGGESELPVAARRGHDETARGALHEVRELRRADRNPPPVERDAFAECTEIGSVGGDRREAPGLVGEGDSRSGRRPDGPRSDRQRELCRAVIDDERSGAVLEVGGVCELCRVGRPREVVHVHERRRRRRRNRRVERNGAEAVRLRRVDDRRPRAGRDEGEPSRRRRRGAVLLRRCSRRSASTVRSAAGRCGSSFAPRPGPYRRASCRPAASSGPTPRRSASR